METSSKSALVKLCKANENIEFGMCDVVTWLVYGNCKAHVTKNAKAALFCKKKKKNTNLP